MGSGQTKRKSLIPQRKLRQREEKERKKEYRNIVDRPVAILGGGPSLPSDLKKIPACTLVSCNHHALRLVDAHYMVFKDDPNNNWSTTYKYAIKNTKAVKVSPIKGLTDIEINAPQRILDTGETGKLATWFGCLLTRGTVYLCGMGLRQVDQPEHFYHDFDKKGTLGGPKSMQRKIDAWMEAISLCYKPERIKAVSGPLKQYLK